MGDSNELIEVALTVAIALAVGSLVHLLAGTRRQLNRVAGPVRRKS